MRTSASPSRASRLAAGLAVVLAAGVLALTPAVSASAHDYLVSSTPTAGSTQTTALSKVVLTFDDRVLDLSGDGSSNVVEVTSGSRHYETGCPTIADTDVSVPVALGGSGSYTVTWQVVSADGHVVSNSIAFRYVLPAGTTAAAGSASRPTCGDQASGSGASAPAAAAGSGSAGSSASGSSALPVALGVGGGIIVVALVAVAVVLTRSRRTAPAPSPSGQRPQPKRADRSRGSRRQPPPPPAD